MRRLALTIVPLLFLACDREPTAPALPTLSVNRRTEIVRNVSDIVVGYKLGSCGAFDILADWNALLQVTFYYDGDGNLVRQHVRYRVVGPSRYYNSVDPQVGVLGGPGEIQNNRFDFVNNTLTFSGLAWKITLPGYGTILFETGLSVMDLTSGIITRDTGQNQLNAGDLAALCEALTP
jgi:hypothetical protein